MASNNYSSNTEELNITLYLLNSLVLCQTCLGCNRRVRRLLYFGEKKNYEGSTRVYLQSETAEILENE